MSILDARESDRWATPRVIVALILSGTVVILAAMAGVVYLQSIGRSPGPMLDLVAKVTAASAAVGNLVLTLATRRTTAKVERNTGVLAANTGRLVDEVLYEPPPREPDPPASRHGQEWEDVTQAPRAAPGRPVPYPPTAPHPHAGRRAAPDAAGR